MEKQERREAVSGGKENQLVSMAIVLFVIAIIAAVLTIALYSEQAGIALPIAIGVGIWGITVYILLTAAAEVIRLLKKMAGLKYDGKITQPGEKTIYICSKCGTEVSKNAKRCYECGEKLE
jgi:hypothetical protein